MPLRCSTPWLLVFVSGLLCGPIACGRLHRAQECQRLATAVNAKLDEIERLAPRPVPSGSAAVSAAAAAPRIVPIGEPGAGAEAPSAEKYRQMAKLYLELSKDVVKSEPADEQLAKQVALYARLMKRTARALERLADATASTNHPGMRGAIGELRHLQERQRATSQQIDQICLRP